MTNSTSTKNKKPIVVMKFGGTSVANPDSRKAIVQRVINTQSQNINPVVVVSAMGRKPQPYATDTLLSLVEDADITSHERDLLMSVGETISAVVMASVLRAHGVNAKALTGFDAGICTDTVDGCATIETIDKSLIYALLEDGIVPVVCGFQGNDCNGDLKTLGRGGSDTTACALAVALEAESVDIFSDVDGVLTGDPRIIPEAKLVDKVTSEELFQLATSGAKIVHAPAAELALKSNMLMRVRNTFTDAAGTSVVNMKEYRPSTVATSVTARMDISRVRIELPSLSDKPQQHMQLQVQVYEALALAGVSVDMFTPTEDKLLFTVHDNDANLTKGILSDMNLTFEIRDDIAKVSLVGSGMHGVPGVMAKMSRALFDANIGVIQSADSHTTISVLVQLDHAAKTQQVLHDAFGLSE